MNAVKIKLGTIVKYHRNLNNISQIELANEVNVTQSLISKIEAGNKNINLEKYVLVLNYFDIYYINDYSEEIIVEQLIDSLNNIYENRNIDLLDLIITEVKDIEENTFNVLLQYRLKLYYIQSMLTFDTNTAFIDEFKELIDLETLFTDLDLIIYNRMKSFYYLEIGQRILGMEYFIKLEHESKSQGYSSFLNNVLGTMVYYRNNDVLKAIQYLFKSEESCKKTDNVIRLMQIYELFGIIFYYEGQYEDAKYYFSQVESTVNKDAFNKYNQLTYATLALISTDEGNYYEAIERLENVINFNDIRYFKISLYTLIKCYKAVDNKEKVDELHKQIKDHINEDKYQHPLIKAILLKYDNENKEYYKFIESNLLPQLKEERIWKIYFDFCFELMTYYWNNRQYRKYKFITDELVVIKRSLDINYEG